MEIYALLLLFLVNCSSVFCLKLSTELKENKAFFDIGKTLKLQCTADDEKATIQWKKDGKDVNDVFDTKDHYKVTKEGATSTFKIQYTKAEDDGDYSCEAENEVLKFDTIAKAIVKVKPGDLAVVDGEKLVLKCLAYGTDVKVEWILPNTTHSDRVNYEDHEVTSSFKIEQGTLIIDHVKMSDRGTFQCIARNGDDDSTAVMHEAFVRIKDKYAALWPFIFICIEVFILCSIILIYEKKRNKTEVDDSETDAAPETKNGKK